MTSTAALADSSPATPPPVATKDSVFANANFRWLCIGAILSMIGDQFTVIALPLLVLQLTSDSLTLGLVFALIGLPRALFILVGGAAVDHYSPQRVLMLTKYINTALLGTLGALVLTQRIEMWMIYGLATGIGLSTAFSIPSTTAMLPHALPAENLQPANGIMLGLRQASMFLGPLLAGILIAISNHPTKQGGIDTGGLGLAFVLNAFTFAISAWTLAQVIPHTKAAETSEAPRKSVMQLMGDGLRFCWNDAGLRICFFYGAAIAFFISGPMQVAVPILAVKLHNPAAMGILMGAHGAGTLLGMILSGVKPTWRIGSLGTTILVLDLAAGVLFVPMGHVAEVWQGSGLLLVIGGLAGFLQVALFTWIQQRVPLEMMGRAMSLFMFVAVGVAPISSSLTGWVLRQLTLTQLFMASGGLLIVTVLAAGLTSSIRGITEQQRAGVAASRERTADAT